VNPFLLLSVQFMFRYLRLDVLQKIFVHLLRDVLHLGTLALNIFVGLNFSEVVRK